MWRLWNDIREDGDQSASLLGKDKSKTSKGEKGKYNYTFSGQSIADSVKAVTNSSSSSSVIKGYDGGYSTYNPTLPYPGNTTAGGSKQSSTFELNDGKFASPERAPVGSNGSTSSRAPSTYTYNNNTYNVNQSSKTPEGVKASPASRQVLNNPYCTVQYSIVLTEMNNFHFHRVLHFIHACSLLSVLTNMRPTCVL